MSQELLSLIENWDGNGVVVRHDRPTGTWIFIALHDDTLGPSAGGTRMKSYPDLAAGLRDAMRLAEGMTYKWAGIGIDLGGGKAVLATPRPLEGAEKEGLLERYGALVASLRGAFATGADLGTGPAEMAIVRRKTPNVFGAEADGSAIDPGPFTARGVLAGLRASVQHVFGSADVAGRRILVEGLGGVGIPLARSLADGGARLIFADLDTAKAEDLARQLGAKVVGVEEVPTTECDVYAPCAVGATLNRDTVPRLRCRIVAGSANNQLREDADAGRLHQRGIVYAPDYVINAGGAMALYRMSRGEDRDAAFERVATLGDTVADILQQAAETSESPLVAARRRVDRILAARRA